MIRRSVSRAPTRSVYTTPKMEPVSKSNRDDARLSIVRAVVDALKCWAVEDERGECEIETAFREVRSALARIP